MARRRLGQKALKTKQKKIILRKGWARKADSGEKAKGSSKISQAKERWRGGIAANAAAVRPKRWRASFDEQGPSQVVEQSLCEPADTAHGRGRYGVSKGYGGWDVFSKERGCRVCNGVKEEGLRRRSAR